MKNFFLSVGLVAAGTASLQAAYAPDATDASKLWSISGTLRGFYDNNYATAPSSSSRGSYGFEVSPSLQVNKPLQQTEIGLKYTYGLYYYQDRQELNENPIDQTHQLDFWIDHAFTERWQARFQDSFVVAQEPQLLAQGAPSDDPDRVEGNNIANSATVRLNTDWTRLFSTVLTYQNGFYDYQQNGATVATNMSGTVTAVSPSLAGELNRVENSISLDLQWHIKPTTTVLVGYRFGQINYTAGEPIAAGGTFSAIHNSVTNLFTVPERYSDSRDNISHTGYIGLQHNIFANLAINGNVGVTYTDDYNDPQDSTSLSPYANVSLTYTYQPGDYAQIGFVQTRNATDEVSVDPHTGSIALDQDSSLIYGSINHQLSSKLLAALIAQAQISTFNGGGYNNEVDTTYSLGLNLSYTFNRHFSAEIGDNFDDLSSQVPGRSYSRDRVYMGVTATY
jgi:hypothetical protein